MDERPAVCVCDDNNVGNNNNNNYARCSASLFDAIPTRTGRGGIFPRNVQRSTRAAASLAARSSVPSRALYCAFAVL
jgi:hypothetical protein